MDRNTIILKVDAVAHLVDIIDLDDVAFGRADNALDEISMKAMLLSMEFGSSESASRELAESIARATIAIKQRSAAGDYALVLMRGALALMRDILTGVLPDEQRALRAATLELDMLAPRQDLGPPKPVKNPVIPVSSLIRKKTT